MLYVLIPIYILVCLFLVLVVLLQQGKGADIAGAFGASSTQTAFGARGATTLLEKITTWAFVAFSVLAVAISLIQARPKTLNLSGSASARPAAPASAAPSVPATTAPATTAPAAAVPASPASPAAK